MRGNHQHIHRDWYAQFSRPLARETGTSQRPHTTVAASAPRWANQGTPCHRQGRCEPGAPTKTHQAGNEALHHEGITRQRTDQRCPPATGILGKLASRRLSGVRYKLQKYANHHGQGFEQPVPVQQSPGGALVRNQRARPPQRLQGLMPAAVPPGVPHAATSGVVTHRVLCIGGALGPAGPEPHPASSRMLCMAAKAPGGGRVVGVGYM